MFKLARLSLTLVCALLVGLTCGAGEVQAAPISPGFDLFETVPESTSATFPGIGVVPLKGVPIGTLMGVDLGDTDTIVQRLQGIDPFPVGGLGNVQIQLRAVSLTNVNPVFIGGFSYDVMILGGDLLGIQPSPIGSMTVFHSISNGGTFTANLPVTTEVFFTPTDGGPPIPPMMRTDNFTSTGVWSHTPRLDDVHTDEVAPFPAGHFYAGVDPVTGQKVLTQEKAALADHGVIPGQAVAVPEPSGLALLASAGVAGLIGVGRRRLFKKA